MSTPTTPSRDRRGRVYTPAIGKGLRPLLWMVLLGFALLGGNGVYLSSVTALTWKLGTTQQTPFYMLMVALHLLLGFLLIPPFILFGGAHLVTSWKRPNKAAVRFGLALLAVAIGILVSGILLVRIAGFEVRDPRVREVGYWLHVVLPLAAIGLYVKHRLAGPRIRWEWLGRFGGAVAAFVVLMGVLHFQDPRTIGATGPKEGKAYFYPSEAVTATGKFIPARTLMMDEYCLKCHKDAYEGWFHSAHHLSSFNNKMYLSSVRETRKVALERDGSIQAARWCAGCHDPVPFFSGEFDDPNYDDVNNPTSQAGITCTVCHSITNVNNTRGNGAYTISEPQHYPFAASDDTILAWINHTLVKAKPEMHKKTFMNPLLKDPKFCSTCHKVGLPLGVTKYKDFVRGQNHYDPFLLSGVSGKGARSFYYPPKAKENCNACHMELKPSDDFGARDFAGNGTPQIHDHLFIGANTGLATVVGDAATAKRHAQYLADKKVRIDILGLRDGGTVDGEFMGPIRPEAPTLKPGGKYLVEVVVRTLNVGHLFSQGTVDSNEIWVELVARAGDRVIGRSGGIDENGYVDAFSHFINVYMLDRNGNRIDRRNPQDIFVALYNKQIPPGAGQVVHFGLEVPTGLSQPVTLEARLNYRKFDRTYFDYIFGKGKGPRLPVVEMAQDSVKLPVAGGAAVVNPPSPIADLWQRYNDYGIGLLLEGGNKGGQKGELKQAEEVFKKVAELGQPDGWINLARVYQKEGRIPEALSALEKAAQHEKTTTPWVINWLSGQINARNGLLDEAVARFESVLATRIPARGIDLSTDYEVINELGQVHYGQSRLSPVKSDARKQHLQETIATYRRTLAIDSENDIAHYGLGLAFSDPAWRSGLETNSRPLAEAGPGDVPAEAILDLARKAVSPGAPAADRSAAYRAITSDVARFMDRPPPQFESRLEPLFGLLEILDPAWDAERDPVLRFELANALAAIHKRLHERLKVDETAEGRAFSLARRRDPAADQNAQSIVIHSLHRPGAPLRDAPSEAAPVADHPETPSPHAAARTFHHSENPS